MVIINAKESANFINLNYKGGKKSKASSNKKETLYRKLYWIFKLKTLLSLPYFFPE